jgi:indole-3-glycerol phosphate synthase
MNRDFLSEIVARKREEVTRIRATTDLHALRNRALKIRESAALHRLRAALEATTPTIKIIAEFKRKSPSRGTIRSDLSASDVAAAYERGGACAISILTDKEYFGGALDDLISVRASTTLSILRKDFLIDPIQIYEASAAGADAVLLIVAILDETRLGHMRMIAEDELGLDALIEAHTSEDLRRARNAGARLIGINNRDLHTFEVSLSTSERLVAEAPRDVLMVSESGLHNHEQLRRLQSLGFRGFLIGETLMQADDPAAALRELTNGVVT